MRIKLQQISIIALSITCLYLGFLLYCIISKQKNLTQTNSEYKDAADPKQRLLYCIEVINDESIQSGMPFKNLEKLFGSDLILVRHIDNGKKIYKVRFEEDNIKFGDSSYARGFRGWYLQVTIGPNDTIYDYYLSNVHK